MLLFALLFSSQLIGCASSQEWVTIRDTPHNRFAGSFDRYRNNAEAPSQRTIQLLRHYDLEWRLNSDRLGLIAQLDQIPSHDRKREREFAMAELAYGQAAQEKNRDRALELYSTAVLHSYRYLFDESQSSSIGPLASNPYDPQFRGACDLYNQSLEGLLRLVQSEGEVRPGDRRTIATANHRCSFDIELKSSGWHAEDFQSFKFVTDFQVNGLRNHYHTYGLGVPLIAIRQTHDDSEPAEQFYPEQLCFPITAFLRIRDPQNVASPATGVQPASYEETAEADAPRFVLELHDPIDKQALSVNGKSAPLESDLSTPLAYFLNKPALRDQKLSTIGLFNPDKVKDLQGLYMLEPFDPNKMPVLMVHGLWSSPATWMEMFNDLRSDPNISSRYQFWFYLYPTGQPFWVSASQMRSDLSTLRQELDPKQAMPALDQMVLVGHSMGGLVSKLQTIDSGSNFWQLNTDRAFDDLVAEPEVKDQLAKAYFFRPNVSVRRVVTIGTPHRGSSFSNGFTRWLGQKLIAAPMRLMQGRQTLLASNPGYFREQSVLNTRTSIDSLSPDSPILPVLLSARPGPWVDYHNIVGRVPEKGIRKFINNDGDGVVSFESASLEKTPQLVSQVIVPSDHVSIHRHPLSVKEVRRILSEQIVALENLPYGRNKKGIQLASATNVRAKDQPVQNQETAQKQMPPQGEPASERLEAYLRAALAESSNSGRSEASQPRLLPAPPEAVLR